MENKDIINSCVKEGTDLVGITKIGDLPQTHPKRSPKDIHPGAKSIIVFALKHSYGALESPTMRVMINETLSIYLELNRIGYRLSRFLEKNGFGGTTVHLAYPVEMSEDTRGLIGDLSFRHAASSAGLGFIGKSKLLITPEFGPRVRLAAVITDAALDSNTKRIETKCSTCNISIEMCSAKATSFEGVDVRRCAKVVGGPAGLNSLLRFFTEVVDKSKEEVKKMIRSSLVWSFHQAFQVGISYDCHACMSCCPLGKEGKKAL